ncbi:hypothetical protein GCM10022408_00360 [Hymenobacter fastidiosus]|uniref:Uncharacterized protein n=1 Tax=Hymenobacter fastidiosus TaxID=486264 RepID=A0ABP7R8T9_9BACT
MKLLLLLLVLSAAVRATPPTKLSRPAARKPAVALSSPVFFRQHNLAPLWALNAQSGQPQVLIGCMGPQYRRLELVYERVRRDSKNRQLYHVWGQSRERERIMPFRGTILLTAVKKVRPQHPAEDFRALAHYQAAGRFRFREDPAGEGSGQLSGTLTMTFSRVAGGLAYMPGQSGGWDYPMPGEGSRFTSTWTSAAHPEPVKLVWATNFMDIANTVIERFLIGDRGVHINPKYARLGWSRYWENDEWWAEAGTVVARTTPLR